MRTSLTRVLVVFAAIAVVALGWGRQAWTQGRQGSESIGVGGARPESQPDLWDALTPLDRQILELVNESQLEELLNGIDPADIYLSNGETLSALAARTQAETTRNLLFAPVRPCRLIDTRLTDQGRVLSGETRGFRVRAAEEGYARQGGAAQGCGLPGLDGATLKTNAVRAVALNVQTVEADGPGSLAIWPANRSEPEIGSVSFGGGGLAGGLLVAVCDEAGLDPCSGGDLKIKAKISGSHVVADVVGYFHAAGTSLARISKLATEKEDADDVEGESTSSADLPSPPVHPQAQPAVRQQLSNGLRSVAIKQSVLPPYPNVNPNPFGGHAKISAALTTGDGDFPGPNIQQAIGAHLENTSFSFRLNAIRGTATTGNAIYGRANNGRAIYGQTEDGYAVYGFDGGSNANQGYAGYFYSTNGIGVYGYSGANRTHPNIYAPGVYGQSNQGVGVYGRGDTSSSHSFFNEGGYFEGGRGIYARGRAPDGSAGYGARIYSDNYRGMYVEGDINWFDAYFGGDTGISTFGITDRSALAINLGMTAIEPGDLIAIAGVSASPENGKPMLAVARVDATNRHAVIGVAKEAFSAERISERDGKEYTDFSPTDGAVPPKGYLAVVTEGLAPAVKVSGLAQASSWQIGAKIALSADGAMELAEGKTDAVTIGKVVSPVNYETGTVAIFVDID